jgi:hypothetical protein
VLLQIGHVRLHLRVDLREVGVADELDDEHV